MLRKIKAILNGKFGALRTNSTVEIISNDVDNKFRNLIISMNDYFENNPTEKKKFVSELAFLNSGFQTDPLIDKINYAVLPYPFILSYDYHKVEVYKDEKAGMFFVYLDGKKLYYHRGFTNIENVKKSFTFLCAEQNVDSPHRYLDENFTVTTEDVVADIGAAEGNFSLLIVDKVKELIIVEADAVWVEALHKTFEPWKEKVTIINKFAGSDNNDKTITIDKLETNNKLTMLKMDIEGAEVDVLNCVQTYLMQNKIKMAITTYHKQTDAEEIENLLVQNKYYTRFSKGYMLFVNDKLHPPYFRHGLIKTDGI